MTSPLTAVSLFTGAGGIDIGLERAGFRVITANDNDPDSCATLERNRKLRHPVLGRPDTFYLAETHIICAPIEELDPGDLWTDQEAPTLLSGGPPCQPFSSAGSQLGLTDKRGRLFEHFVRIAADLRPTFILFENVRGLVTQRGPKGEPGEALNLVRAAFEEIGYATTFRLIRCADYGLPQRRVRLSMMGVLSEALNPLPSWPEPTHSKDAGDQQFLLGGRKPWVTLGEFLSQQPPPPPEEVILPSPRLHRELKKLPPGKGIRSPGRREPTRPGGHWGYQQGTFIADPSLPARTVTASSSQDWIREDDGRIRRLTVAECAGLQGFPCEWEFVGTRASKYRQVGNAVPVPIAHLLGESIATAAKMRMDEPPVSDEFPAEFTAAIAYTRRDSRRNAVARVRLLRNAGDAEGVAEN